MRPFLATGSGLMALACSLLLLSPSLSAFRPEYHANITRDVLRDVTRTIEGHTLRFTTAAIDEIVNANTDQDNGWQPCGAGGAAELLSPTRGIISTVKDRQIQRRCCGTALNEARGKLTLDSPKVREARKLLGQALHATQDYLRAFELGRAR